MGEGTIEGQELPTESVPTTEFEEAAEPTIDDLYSMQVSEEEVKQTEKDSILPIGTYTTTPEFRVTVGNKNGRRFARLFGKITLAQEGKEDIKGAIGYPLSWDRRNKIIKVTDDETGAVTEKDSGKPDYLSKNFVQAVKAYTVAHGEAPLDEKDPTKINPGLVVAYLRDYAHRLRVIQTQNNENMVVAISAIVEK